MGEATQVAIVVTGEDKASNVFQGVAKAGDKAAQSIQKSWSQVGASIKKTGETMTKAGQSLSKLSIVTGGVGAAAVKMASDWETSLANMATLIEGDATKSINELDQGMKSLLKTIPKSADELGAAGYALLSGGVKDTTAAIAALEDAGKLSTAGLGELNEATELMVLSMSGLGKTSSDTKEISDILFKTVKNGITTVSQLSTNFGSAAGEAAAIGVSLEDLMAATAALTTISKNAAKEQTRLAALFREVGDAGGPLAKAIIEAGGSFEDFQRAVSEKGIGAAMEELRDSMNMTNEEFKLLFGSAEAGGAAFGLLAQKNAEYTATLQDMLSGENALDEAFQKKLKTTQAVWQITKNKMNVAFMELGNQILPALVPIVEKIGVAFEKAGTIFSKMSPTMKTIVVAFGALVTAAGPLLLILGSITTAAGSLIANWGLIAGAFAAVKAAAIAVGASLAGLALPITAVVAAVALLAVAWSKNWGDIQGKTKAAWDAITKYTGMAVDILKAAFRRVWDEITDTTAGIISTLQSWGNSVKTAMSPIAEFLLAPFVAFKNAIVETLGPLAELVGGKVQDVINTIKEGFTDLHTKAVQDELDRFMGDVYDQMTEVYSDTNLGAEARQAAFAKILEEVEKFHEDNQDIAGKLRQDQKINWENMVADLQAEAGPMGEAVGKVSAAVGDAMQDMADKTKDGAEKISQALKDIQEDFKSFTTEVTEDMTAASILESVDPSKARDKWLEIGSDLESFMESNLHNIQNWTDEQKQTVLNLTDDIESALKKLYSDPDVLIGDADRAMADKMNLIREIMEKQGFAAFEAWDTGISNVVDVAEDLPSEISEALVSNSPEVINTMTDLGEQAAMSFSDPVEEGLVDGAEQAADSMAETFTIEFDRATDDAADVLEDGIKDAVEIMNDAMDRELEDLDGIFDQRLQAIEDRFNETMDRIKAEQEELRATEGEVGALTDIMGQIDTLLSEAQKAAQELEETAPTWDPFKKFKTPQDAQAAYDEYLTDLDDFTRGQELAEQHLADVQNRLADVLAEGQEASGGLLADVAGTPIEEQVKALIALFGEYANSAGNNLTSVGLDAEALGNALWRIQWDFDEANESVQAGLDNMDQALQDQAQNTRDQYEQTKEQMKADFDDASEHIKSKYEEIQTSLEDGNISIAESFDKLGLDIETSMITSFENITNAAQLMQTTLDQLATPGAPTTATITPGGAQGGAFSINPASKDPTTQALLDYWRREFGYVPSFQGGGIALKDMIARVGEQGPEAVIPLDKIKDFTGGQGQPINVTLNMNVQSLTVPSDDELRQFYRRSYNILREVIAQNATTGI